VKFLRAIRNNWSGFQPGNSGPRAAKLALALRSVTGGIAPLAPAVVSLLIVNLAFTCQPKPSRYHPDFGIAKATEGRLTDATVYTQLHQFIGTPAYMSPEQAEMSGLDMDTRNDIYSFGALLYELLTGETPFDAQELMSQ
jgi:serine/threonine protein kinase